MISSSIYLLNKSIASACLSTKAFPFSVLIPQTHYVDHPSRFRPVIMYPSGQRFHSLAWGKFTPSSRRFTEAFPHQFPPEVNSGDFILFRANINLVLLKGRELTAPLLHGSVTSPRRGSCCRHGGTHNITKIYSRFQCSGTAFSKGCEKSAFLFSTSPSWPRLAEILPCS